MERHPVTKLINVPQDALPHSNLCSEMSLHAQSGLPPKCLLFPRDLPVKRCRGPRHNALWTLVLNPSPSCHYPHVQQTEAAQANVHKAWGANLNVEHRTNSSWSPGPSDECVRVVCKMNTNPLGYQKNKHKQSKLFFLATNSRFDPSSAGVKVSDWTSNDVLLFYKDFRFHND